MSFKDIVVQYQGFHPSEFTKSYLESLVGEVKREAPRGAKIRASFRRENKSIKAVLQISSYAGQFFASATGLGLHDISRKMLQQLRRQVKKSKSKRHSSLPKEEHNYESA